MAREKDKKGAPATPAAPEPMAPVVEESVSAPVPEASIFEPAAETPAAALDLRGRYRVLRRTNVSLPGQGFVVLRVGAEVSAESHGDRAMAAMLEAGCPLERLPD